MGFSGFVAVLFCVIAAGVMLYLAVDAIKKSPLN